MSTTVRISASELELITHAAGLNGRTVPDQVEHWIRLGRAAERCHDGASCAANSSGFEGTST
ncbi:TA system antitoxin ParD family protein [Caenimonas koreensis]